MNQVAQEVLKLLGMVGRESELFRYTVKHSLIFASVIGIITLLQAYVFTGMLVS